MPVDQLEAPTEATSDTEQLDTTPEAAAPEAPHADASIPAEGSEPSADETSGGASEPAASDEPPARSAELAQFAASYGLDANDFANDASLQRAIAVLDKQLSDWYGKMNQPQQQQQPQQGYHQPQQPQAAPGAFDLNKLLKDAYGDEVDPATQKLLTALHGHYESAYGSKLNQFEQIFQHLPALVQEVNGLKSFHQSQSEARFEQEVDAAFESLPEEWHSIFGKGSLADLPPHSPQVQNRLAAVKQLDVLQKAEEAVGRKPSSIKKLLERSLPLSFADHHNTLARRSVTSQLKKNNGAALARSSPKGTKPNGMSKLVEMHRQFDNKFFD